MQERKRGEERRRDGRKVEREKERVRENVFRELSAGYDVWLAAIPIQTQNGTKREKASEKRAMFPAKKSTTKCLVVTW